MRHLRLQPPGMSKEKLQALLYKHRVVCKKFSAARFISLDAEQMILAQWNHQ